MGFALSANDGIREFAYFEEITFDALFYVVGTVLPVGCQLSTLVFAYAKQKKPGSKKKLKLNNHNQEGEYSFTNDQDSDGDSEEDFDQSLDNSIPMN